MIKLLSGGESIPVIRVAPGLTTMLSLPDEAREAVCGDLFDPATGTGGFVIQRSGRDLFVKPLKPSGTSNLFVKTPGATLAFELVVVDQASAMRIVQVDAAAPDVALAETRGQLEAERNRARAEADDLGKRISALTDERDAARRDAAACATHAAEISLDGWLAKARWVVVAKRSAGAGMVELELGPYILSSPDRALLPLIVRNRGRTPLVIASIDARDGTVCANPVSRAVPPLSSTAVIVFVPPTASSRLEVVVLDASGRRLCAARPLK